MLPVSWEEWGRMDAVALADLVRSGRVTPKQLAEQAAEAVKIVNPKLNAVLEVFDDVVQDPYKDGMSKDGPLHGVPMLIKDLGSAMKGRLQQSGSMLCKGVRADHDSPLVENFRAAGLNLIGRTATPPFGWASVTESFISGITRNPWNVNYSPRGSSGGSAAAVAAGVVPIAMASDGGGSIRDPAAVCGLIGLKTTRGRNPLPEIWGELAAHIVCEGVLTRTVRDSALALDYMSRHKLGDTFMPIPKPERPYVEEVTRAPSKLRIAFSMGKWGRERTVDSENVDCTRRVANVLESVGHSVEEVEDEEICDWELLWRSVPVNWIGAAKKWRDVSEVTGVPITEETLEPALYWLYKAAQRYNEFDVWHMQTTNVAITRCFGRFFEKYDLLLSPTTDPVYIKAGPGTGFSPLDKVENEEQACAYIEALMDESRYMIIDNDTGTPAIAVPGGLGKMGLPIGVELHAPWLREDRLLQMAAQLERTKPEWFNQIPTEHVSKG